MTIDDQLKDIEQTIMRIRQTDYTDGPIAALTNALRAAHVQASAKSLKKRFQLLEKHICRETKAYNGFGETRAD